jgi:hypothetical protein
MIQCMSIQLDIGNDKGFSEQDVVAALKRIGRYPEVVSDKPDTVMLNLFTEELPSLWQQVQTQLLGDSELAQWLKQRAVIVAAQIEAREDEVLLLYHHDASQPLDSL